jgi:flagellar hook-length control protein FliK
VDGSTSSQTFAALDADASAGTPAWIHSGAHQAEAGFEDPTLGWVGIRANQSGGGVHAQLTASSADAAQALGSQLSGLNDYLVEHRTPVQTLTLTSSDGGAAGQSAGQGTQQNAGHQSGQDTTYAGNQVSPYQSSTVRSEVASSLLTGLDGTAQAAMSGEAHISVMA